MDETFLMRHLLESTLSGPFPSLLGKEPAPSPLRGWDGVQTGAKVLSTQAS